MKISDFDSRQWWIAMVIVGSAFLGAAIVAKDRDLVAIALGLVIFAFGEWRSHPLQVRLGYGGKITSYPRRFSVFGTILNLAGIALMAFGGYRYFGS